MIPKMTETERKAYSKGFNQALKYIEDTKGITIKDIYEESGVKCIDYYTEGMKKHTIGVISHPSRHHLAVEALSMTRDRDVNIIAVGNEVNHNPLSTTELESEILNVKLNTLHTGSIKESRRERRKRKRKNK